MDHFIGMVLRQALVLLLSVCWLGAAEAKIYKVLPHLLDEEGRHTLSPSLYERDAYQVYLRENDHLVSALRFDVHYKGGSARAAELLLKIEIRGSKLGIDEAETFETKVKRAGFFSKWAAILLSKEDYDRIGEIIAWRVTLWSGGYIVAEEESFLW